MTKFYTLFLFAMTLFVNGQQIKNDTIELNETILYDKSKFRLKRVGPETKSKAVCIQVPTLNDSIKWNKPKKESFTNVNAPKKEFVIKAINLNFSYPPKEETLKFDLKLYKAFKNNPIDTVFYEKRNIEILPENIVNQMFKIDLSDENINYKDEFYVGIVMTKRLQEEFVCLSGVIFSNGFHRNLSNGGNFQKNPLGAKPSINADILIKR